MSVDLLTSISRLGLDERPHPPAAAHGHPVWCGPAADLNARDPRIVRQIEAYFQKKKIAGGKFNHYKPARTYLREQASLPDLDTATLDRIEKLFQRLNGLIRKIKKK